MLAKIYTEYEWDPSIGTIGGFKYIKYDNDVDEKHITLDNISNIFKCNENITYVNKENCSGLSKTNIELDNIPINSLYGWDHVNNAWVYYIDDIPSYYSNYINY